MVSMRVAAVCSLVGCNFNSSVPGAATGLGEDSSTTAQPATTTGVSPPPSTSTSTSTSTSGSPSTTVDPTTTTPPTDTTSAEETGSSDCFEDATCLLSDGLVARYFLDEADSGQGQTSVMDAAPDAVPLALTYTDAMTFTAIGGNRGLAWTATGDSARASSPVDGTKFADLGGSTTGTWEVVVAIDDVVEDWSRIVHIGAGENSGSFTLSTPTPGSVYFRMGNNATRESIAVPTLESRTVLHLVFDSNEADPADRARFYVDGVIAPPSNEESIALGAQIGNLAGEYFVLGNREVGARSFRGTLFYAALYDTALGPAAVAHNAARLVANDDS
jgi:hypothetical protein